MTAPIGPEIKLILFDVVGTLIKPDPPVSDVYADAARRFGGDPPTPAELRHRFAVAVSVTDAADVSYRTSEARERQRWAEIVAACLPSVADPTRCFEFLWDHFGRPESWAVIAGAVDALSRLAAGRDLALASNFDARLHRLAAGLPGLKEVNRVFVSSELGVRKPSPEFFRGILSWCGREPGEALMVGDDRTNDIDGAAAAGLRSVLFDPTGKHPEAETRIQSWGELR